MLRRLVRAGRHRPHRRRLVAVARHEAEKGLDRVERLFVAVDEPVDEAGDLRVQLPAAQRLAVHLLADRHRHEPLAGDGHDGALPHDAEIGHARVPGGRAVAHAEHRRRPRRFAEAAVLGRAVRQQVPHAERAHVVGNPGAGAFAEEYHRQAPLGRRALHLPDLLHVRGGRGCALYGEIVGDDDNLAPVDAAVAGQLSVAGRVGAVGGNRGGREQARFQKAALVQQIVDPLARVQDACIASALEPRLAAHAERLFPALLVLLVKLLVAHLSRHPAARRRNG